MSQSSAQNVHANNPDGALDAYLTKYDITDFSNNASDLNGTVDSEAIYSNPPHAPDTYWGTGNSVTGYNILDNNTLGFELALKEHARFGADLAHAAGADGVADVTAPAGTDTAGTHALWNFDYVVDTGLNGNTNTLTAYTFKLQITQTATNGTTNTQVFDLNPTTHVWTNEANPASHFGGDDFSGHPATSQVQSQVAENSENLAFLGGVFGPLSTATAAGTTYDIQLEAFKHVQLVGLVHDHVTLA
ncbi:MAG TPA: hypothetical protein VJ728_14035 [Candidatus Binataceae bacterium]|nr:hypothetical protein [Candidatus Binataceae bacterium]